MANLATFRESINQIRHDESLQLLEAVAIDDKTKKELLNISAGVSGATLGGIWASLGVSSTAASVKGVLLAAGFLNPASAAIVGSVAAGVVAVGTVIAGGKIAYQYAKSFTEEKTNADKIQHLLADIAKITSRRDKALYVNKGRSPEVSSITKEMKSASKALAELANTAFQNGEINAHAYKICMSVANKGKLGRLSTLV